MQEQDKELKQTALIRHIKIGQLDFKLTSVEDKRLAVKRWNTKTNWIVLTANGTVCTEQRISPQKNC